MNEGWQKARWGEMSKEYFVFGCAGALVCSIAIEHSSPKYWYGLGLTPREPCKILLYAKISQSDQSCDLYRRCDL